MTLQEFNFDGLVGPSHHYGGLAHGNLAAASNQGLEANPKAAALQGLEKMRRVMRSGVAQGWLPPPLRPDFQFLHEVGFRGRRADVLQKAQREAPELLQAAWSAASMWTANAATVTPSVDCVDRRLHLSVANLTSQTHRALEARTTEHHLRGIFCGTDIKVHPALPATLTDEGAANHTRLCVAHDQPGVHLFVYGAAGRRFRARQMKIASEAIARRHQIPVERCVYAQQSERAIDAGVFHNDVISVGHKNVLLSHEQAFANTDALKGDLQRAISGLDSPFELQWMTATDDDFSIDEAVQSYVFNSQLLDDPDGGIWLLGPDAIHQCDGVVRWLNQLVERGVLQRWETMNLRQSMRNGGGPACLRLRVPISSQEEKFIRTGFVCDENTLDQLEAWVNDHYRDRLCLNDLADSQLADEIESAHSALAKRLGWSEMFCYE